MEGSYFPQGWDDEEFEQRVARKSLIEVMSGRRAILIQAYTRRKEPAPILQHLKYLKTKTNKRISPDFSPLPSATRNNWASDIVAHMSNVQSTSTADFTTRFPNRGPTLDVGSSGAP